MKESDRLGWNKSRSGWQPFKDLTQQEILTGYRSRHINQLPVDEQNTAVQKIRAHFVRLGFRRHAPPGSGPQEGARGQIQGW
jgi:hypothetical protein